MNPFSGFLQPQNNRPLEGLATVQDVLRVNQDNKQLAQRKLENEQQNTRANSYLALQQGDQAHRWNAEEQKQVEGLLAEYQDAEDQGDPVRLSRAAQMLKRFGMDVGKKQVPNLRAFTGEQSLPTVKPPVDVRAFTGEQAAGSQTPESPDLSQEDFEKQLIEGSGKLPERMEQGGESTAEMRSATSSPNEPVDMGDVDSPEFQQAAKAESGVIDLDADSPEPLQIGAPQQATQPRRLATQLLPTVVSKGGKQLYESMGPSNRWSPMVTGVFEPYVGHENPQIAAAAKSAQGFAQKLIQVDGMSPAKAIEVARDQMMKDAGLTVGLERTKLGSKPRYAGGGGTGLLGKTQDIAESAQIYDDNARAQAEKLQQEDVQYESIEGAINSNNPALQRDAVNQLLKIRSGTAVTASEDARISQINGLLAQVQDRLGRWTGGEMTPEMRRTIQQIVALKRQVSQTKIKRIYEHQARLYEAQNEGKVKDPTILKKRADVVRRGANVGTGDDAEEDLY